MRTLSSAPEVITPSMAKSYLERNANNRSLNMSFVKFYADEMKKGLWKLNGEPICFDSNGDLVNGQHRLAAVAMADVPVPFLVCRNVEEGSFATYDSGKRRSAGDVYAVCDILNSTRTAAIVRRYHLMTLGYMPDGKGIGSVGQWTGSGNASLSNQEMVDLYLQHPEEFQEFGAYADCLMERYRLYTQSQVGAVMAFLNINLGHDKLEIYRFFDLLFDYREHPEFNEGKRFKAITMLRERIVNAAMQKQSISAKYKLQLLCKVWAAYVKGADLRSLRIGDNENIEWI